MIFALAGKVPAIFVMLTEADVSGLRKGETRYVNQQHLKGAKFEEIILSLHKTDEDAIALLGQADMIRQHLENPGPRPGEIACPKCSASSKVEAIYEDKCVLCWAAEAKKARINRN